MKTILIGLSLLGLTNLAHPHSNNGGNGESLRREILPSNQTYLCSVQENSSSGLVLTLQNMAAEFDPKTSLWMEKGSTIFNITFHKGSGTIQATYDSNGNIIKTIEKYNNVSLPASVRNSVWKEYQGYQITRSSYEISYAGGKRTKAFYKVWLEKEGNKKKLKMYV